MPCAIQKFGPPSELGGLLTGLERFQHLEPRMLPSVIAGTGRVLGRHGKAYTLVSPPEAHSRAVLRIATRPRAAPSALPPGLCLGAFAEALLV